MVITVSPALRTLAGWHAPRQRLTGRAGLFRPAGGLRSAAKACGQSPSQILFRSAAGEVEIRFCERVDQRANEMCAADAGPVCRPDVSDKPTEKHNLPSYQHPFALR